MAAGHEGQGKGAMSSLRVQFFIALKQLAIRKRQSLVAMLAAVPRTATRPRPPPEGGVAGGFVPAAI